MRRTESIELTLRASRKSGNTAVLTQRSHRFPPSGENLMRVSLMANIPYQPVLRRVEHIMQCDGQFYRAQVRRKMTARFCHRLKKKFTQLSSKLRQLLSL